MTTIPNSDDKPDSLDDYRQWLDRSHEVQISGRLLARYEAVTARLREQFVASGFWQQVGRSLRDFDAAYRLGADGYPLFFSPEPELPTVETKSFDSFIEKTYRRNVVENIRWPDAPESGWLVPDEWYSIIGDLVRTSMVVKYLDGVEFLGERLRAIAVEHGVFEQLTYEARMEGHYAAHLHTRHEFTIPGVDWDTRKISIRVELQITTQLQEVIRRLLHRYYETHRKAAGKRHDWQWDYRSDEFVANYLGHILHYVEGMIMEVRNRQDREIGPGSERKT